MNLDDPDSLEFFYSLRFNYPVELIEDSVLKMVIEECDGSIERVLRRLDELTGVSYKLAKYMVSNELAVRCVRRRYPKLAPSDFSMDLSAFRKLVGGRSIFGGRCIDNVDVGPKREWRQVVAAGMEASGTHKKADHGAVSREDGNQILSGDCKGIKSDVDDGSASMREDHRLSVLLECFSHESAVLSGKGYPQNNGMKENPSNTRESPSLDDNSSKKIDVRNAPHKPMHRPVRQLFRGVVDQDMSWRYHLCEASWHYSYRKKIQKLWMVCDSDKFRVADIIDTQTRYIEYHISKAIERVFDLDSAKVDLHGFNLQISSKFVVGLLESWYNRQRKKLARWRLHIITGRGSHSKRGPVLASMVTEKLTEHGIEYKYVNLGMIEYSVRMQPTDCADESREERSSNGLRPKGYTMAIEQYYIPKFSINVGEFETHQYVLCHTNGLLVVGLAPMHRIFTEKRRVCSVSFLSERRDLSKNVVRGAKKKGGARLRPDSTLATITCTDGSEWIARSCVKGFLLEVNMRLLRTPELLHQMPWTKGYLAIIRTPYGDKGAIDHLLSIGEYYDRQ